MIAASVVLLASGCSKGSGPTQEQYASMADSVCTASDERMDELRKSYDESVYEAALTGEESTYVARPERWLRARIIPAYESMSGQLRGLRPPDDDAQYLADLYADLDLLIKDLNQRPSQGRELISEDERLRDRFASYGMEVCGTV